MSFSRGKNLSLLFRNHHGLPYFVLFLLSHSMIWWSLLENKKRMASNYQKITLIKKAPTK